MIGTTIRGGACHRASDHRATTLYSVGPQRPDHDAVMRIGGEAPRRRTHSRNRCQHHGLLRVTATSDRYRIVLFRQVPRACHLTPFATRRQPEPRLWSPGATGQLATCAPEPRSLFCFFPSALGSCPIPLGQCTVFLEAQKAPSQLDHPAAYSCVARLGEPFLSPFTAALVRGAGETRIARHGSSIPQFPRQLQSRYGPPNRSTA